MNQRKELKQKKQTKPQPEKGNAGTAKENMEPHKEPRLLVNYRENVVPALKKRLGVRNLMKVPGLSKITLNMGVGGATQDAKLLDDAVENMRNISGQQPVVIKAKKAISNFKLRKGQPVGCKVTLHGYMLYEFYDRLVNIAIPRVRDFRGVSRKSFDGHGNYTLGIKEQIVFNEVDTNKVTRIFGMDITLCTTADNDEWALALLEEMGMPFRKVAGA